MSEWNSNDYGNLVTICASAIASVLLVIFKSRCSKISICYGLLSCDRKVMEDEPDKKKEKKPLKTEPSSQQPEPEPQDLY